MVRKIVVALEGKAVVEMDRCESAEGAGPPAPVGARVSQVESQGGTAFGRGRPGRSNEVGNAGDISRDDRTVYFVLIANEADVWLMTLE